MDLTKYLRHDIEKIRNMSKEEIYALHKDTYICPEGLTYEIAISRINYLLDKIGFTPTNEQLHAILCAQEGHPLVIEAVPGAGKTTVTTFIVICDYLIHGVNPNKMLLTSFSNGSSVGMQEKHLEFARLIGCNPVTAAKTMHSWYLSFIKQYKTYTRIPASVTEITTLLPEEATRLLRDTYISITGDKFVSSNVISQIYGVYTYIYDAMLMGDREAITDLRIFTELGMEYDVFHKIITQFDSTKLVLGRIDFTDMQVIFYELLRDYPQVRAKIASFFDLILIDEVQDTSKLQLNIYSMLVDSNNRCRLRLIGDNDQAIYRWRGTSKEIFSDIFTTFPDAELLTLGYNMRSTPEIIEFGNNLIKHNPNRIDKHMVSPRNLKGVNEILPCKSRLEAVNLIYDRLSKVYANNPRGNYDALKNHCVLVRNHNQALWLVDKLLGAGIPARLLGGYFPYNDKIILDLTDIMGAILSPSDAKLGSIAIPKLCADVKAKMDKQVLMQMNLGRKLYEVQFDVIPNKFTPEPTFKADMEAIKACCELKNPTVSDMCKILIPLYRTGSYDYYAKKNAIDAEHYELIFEYLLEQHVPLNTFLTKLNNVREQLEHTERMDLGFRITSIHASKGLEYESLYLLDCSSKSCPNERNLNTYRPKDAYDFLVEERNLFYVAITRAKLNLCVTYNLYSPSIFNAESGLIKPEHLKNVKPLPKPLLSYIQWIENPATQQNNAQFATATKMESSVVTNRQTSQSAVIYKSSANTVASFTPKFVLDSYYLNVLRNLKF